jgi:hypothetical protein
MGSVQEGQDSMMPIKASFSIYVLVTVCYEERPEHGAYLALQLTAVFRMLDLQTRGLIHARGVYNKDLNHRAATSVIA